MASKFEKRSPEKPGSEEKAPAKTVEELILEASQTLVDIPQEEAADSSFEEVDMPSSAGAGARRRSILQPATLTLGEGSSSKKVKSRVRFKPEVQEKSITPEADSPGEPATVTEGTEDDLFEGVSSRLRQYVGNTEGSRDAASQSARILREIAETEYDELSNHGGIIVPNMVPMFKNPITQDYFQSRLGHGKVCLEDANYAYAKINGSIAVQNLEHEKEVLVHYTLDDDWSHKYAKKAEFFEHVNETNTDRFVFSFFIWNVRSCAKFYVEYRTPNSGVHFDNNEGCDYVYERKKRNNSVASPTKAVTETEDSAQDKENGSASGQNGQGNQMVCPERLPST